VAQPVMTAQRRLVQILTAVGAAVTACFQTASAQCPAGAQIFIDPRLAPQRPQVSQDQMARILASPSMDPGIKNTMYQQYMMQYQPIEVPYRGGTVLINPRDPCIQQYVGQ
jgi:hypothetical protein